MKIETDYSVGDEVFFMQDNKIDCGSIDGLYVKVNNGKTEIKYSIYVYKDGWLSGGQLYKTQEELAKSLLIKWR